MTGNAPRKRKKKITPGGVLMFILAAIWLLATVFPLYFTLISSFKDDEEIFANFFAPPTIFQVENYVRAQEMSNILQALLNSLIISASAIVSMMMLDILVAYIIARKKVPFSGVFTILFSAALMVPIQCALIPIVQMVAKIGGYNSIPVVTLIYVALNMSLCFFVLMGSIRDVSHEIDEAAEIDGCHMFQIIFRIIAPMIKPALATCSIVSFLFIYNELAVGNVLLNLKHLRTVSVALLAFKGDFGAYYAYSFAAIVIAIIPTVLFYLLAQERVEQGLTAGAVKG